MDQIELAERFERERRRMRTIAYRLLGSAAEADDAVQEAWFRLQRVDAEEIEDLGAWLGTVVSRIGLNTLRLRRARAEHSLERYVLEPLIDIDTEGDPEHEALLADAVGVALQVVLETLSPAERLAFVLHDMFALSFREIADILDRSPEATRQLASRARRRVREQAPVPDPDLGRQRAVVDAYFAAAREGDLEALVAVLHPDVALRTHGRGPTTDLTGAERVARGAVAARRSAPSVRPALVNGAAGALATQDGVPFAILAFTVCDGRVVAIDIFNDPERVRQAVAA